MSVAGTPRSLHTVPQPFRFHSAQRAKPHMAPRAASSVAQPQPASAVAVRGFKAGSLTPHSLSITQRTAASRAVCEAGEYDADAVCRRLDVEFAIDHAALDSITAQTDSHTLSSAAVGQRHEGVRDAATVRQSILGGARRAHSGRPQQRHRAPHNGNRLLSHSRLPAVQAPTHKPVAVAGHH